MPSRQKRDQQHLRQRSARKKSRPQAESVHYVRPKPGFPMNILTDIRYFSVIGVVVVAAMVFVAVITQLRPDPARSDIPATETPAATVDPNATATPTVVPTKTPLTFSQAESVTDATKDYLATLNTARGEIVIRLYTGKAPNTVNSFVFLAQKGFFTGITFHRIEREFVAQTGDPTGSGAGGPGYETEQEQTDLKNVRGTVSMARARGLTTFGSQFFINLKDNPALDQSQPSQDPFYPFGEVVKGMDVVDTLQKGDLILNVSITETPR